jgi:hypothetical protein
MASFTDQIPKFNPYIQQLPVEAMVAVGMEKQKRYDEGVQKIQQTIDNVAGLQVSRDVDRAYLQSKLNQLGTNLRTFAASDFSNFQLVNTVSGMTKQIANDPNVQTAVSSTMKRQKELEYMEEARKKGELTPQNESYFRERDSAWLNSTELGKGYNARYTPYFDHFKHAKEVFDTMKIDEFTFDEIFQKNADGSYARDKQGNLVANQILTRKKEEGYLPAKLESAIDMIFNDPRVKQQIVIDGEYNYKSVTPEAMVQLATQEINSTKRLIEDQLDTLDLFLNTNPGNEEALKLIKEKEQLLSSLPEKLMEISTSIQNDPDGARQKLYLDKIKNQYKNAFNFKKTSETVHDNPLFKANLEVTKMQNDLIKWQEEKKLKIYEIEQANIRHDKTLANNMAIAMLKAKPGKGADGSGTDDFGRTYTNTTLSSDLGLLQVYEDEKYQAAKNREKASIDLAFDNLIMSDRLIDTNQAEYDGIVNRIKSEGKLTGEDIYTQAKKEMLAKVAKQKGYATMDDYLLYATRLVTSRYSDPKTRNSLDLGKRKILESFETANDKFEQIMNESSTSDQFLLNEFDNMFKDVNFKERKVKIGNDSFTITKQDAIDLSIIAKYREKSTITKLPLIKTKEAQELEKLAEISEKRMIRNGKTKLMNSFLDNALLDKNTRKSLSQRTSLPSELMDEPGASAWLFGVKDSSSRQRTYFKTRAFDDVYSIYDNLNVEKLVPAISEKANAIRANYVMDEPTYAPLLTGNSKQDKTLLIEAKAIANENINKKLGTGNNHKELFESISKASTVADLNKLGINIEYETSLSGPPQALIRDSEGNFAYLTEEEALRLGSSPSYVYAPSLQNSIETRINTYNGKTSKGPVEKKTTYRNEKGLLNTEDFPLIDQYNRNLQPGQLPIQVKLHLKEIGSGQTKSFLPYFYFSAGDKDEVFPVQKEINRNQLLFTLQGEYPSQIDPKLVMQYLQQVNE